MTSLAEAPNQNELCPCASVCCVAYSIYPVFPDCLGVYCKGVCCGCIEVEQLLCKISKTEESYCKLCNGEVEIIKPTTFCKLTSTVCCLDARVALPTDAEVPCQLACLGLVCVKGFECVCKCYSTADGQQAAKV